MASSTWSNRPHATTASSGSGSETETGLFGRDLSSQPQTTMEQNPLRSAISTATESWTWRVRLAVYGTPHRPHRVFWVFFGKPYGTFRLGQFCWDWRPGGSWAPT